MNRLRIRVEKNGKYLGAVGCLDRGILSVGFSLGVEAGGLEAASLEIPGPPALEETANWHLGGVEPGDVVTMRLLVRGRRSRPDERKRATPKRQLAEAQRALRLGRKRRNERMTQLMQMLKTGKFAVPPRRATKAGPALRISIGDRHTWTVTSAAAERVSFSLSGIFRPSDDSPSFEAHGAARTHRQLLFWGLKRIKVGAVVRIEALSSGRATPPRDRRSRSKGPSTPLQAKRAIKRLEEAEVSHTQSVRDLKKSLSKRTE